MSGLISLTACGTQNILARPEPTATLAPLSQPTAQPATPVTPIQATLTPAAALAVEMSATPAPAAVKPTAASGGSMDTPTITLNDNGATLKLKTGQRFLLQLGEMYDWQLIVADQSVVSRVKNVMVVRGARGLFGALNPGQSEVSAMGNPPVCRS